MRPQNNSSIYMYHRWVTSTIAFLFFLLSFSSALVPYNSDDCNYTTTRFDESRLCICSSSWQTDRSYRESFSVPDRSVEWNPTSQNVFSSLWPRRSTHRFCTQHHCANTHSLEFFESFTEPIIVFQVISFDPETVKWSWTLSMYLSPHYWPGIY